jgi:hypothetical protein
VIARGSLPAEASALIEYFRSMRGAIHVAFEEGTQAQWLHDLLAPVVDRVIVRDRRGERRGNKADQPDADRLSHRLLNGDLRAAMVIEARRDPAWDVLCSIPFFGPVRVALLLATMKTPWRSGPGETRGPTPGSRS